MTEKPMPNVKPRLLLVDDEPSILKTVGKRLEIEGFEVLTAVDGEQAVAKARAEKPNLINEGVCQDAGADAYVKKAEGVARLLEKIALLLKRIG